MTLMLAIAQNRLNGHREEVLSPSLASFRWETEVFVLRGDDRADERLLAEHLLPLPLRLGEVPVHQGLDETTLAQLRELELPLPSSRLRLEPTDPRGDLVREVLAEIGASDVPDLIVVNKADAAPEEAKAIAHAHEGAVLISARTGEGVAELLRVLGDRLRGSDRVIEGVAKAGGAIIRESARPIDGARWNFAASFLDQQDFV